MAMSRSTAAVAAIVAAATLVEKSAAEVCDASISSVAILKEPSVDSDCLGTGEGEVCTAWCRNGYVPAEADMSTFKCNTDTFVKVAGEGEGEGNLVCTPQPCKDAFPSGPGVKHNCEGKVTGETCEASCKEGSEGDTQTFTCDGSGMFDGMAPTCKGPCDDSAATVALLKDSNVDSTACLATPEGGECEATCMPGYGPPTPDGIFTTRFSCSSGTFVKKDNEEDLECSAPQVCTETPDATDESLDGSACAGKVFGETCNVTCAKGYVGQSATATCSGDGSFTYEDMPPWCIDEELDKMDQEEMMNENGLALPCDAATYPDAKPWFDAIEEFVDALSEIEDEADRSEMLSNELLPVVKDMICENLEALEQITASSKCDMITAHALSYLGVDSACLCSGRCDEMWDLLTEVKDKVDSADPFANPTPAECGFARCYVTEACDPKGTSMEAHMEDLTAMVEDKCPETRSQELGDGEAEDGEIAASLMGGAGLGRGSLARVVAAASAALAAFALR